MRATRLCFRLAYREEIDALVNINIDEEGEYRAINEKMFSKIIPEQRVYVAVVNNVIVALLYWQKHFWGRTNIWYLEQITVSRVHRGKGYGFLLLKNFLIYVKTNGIVKLFADIHNDNIASLKLFLNAGALISGTIEGMKQGRKQDLRVIVRFDLD